MADLTVASLNILKASVPPKFQTFKHIENLSWLVRHKPCNMRTLEVWRDETLGLAKRTVAVWMILCSCNAFGIVSLRIMDRYRFWVYA